MISVAMTTYNGEKFVIKQLESLKNQTLRIDEIIIVDDCSRDNTVRIVREYIEKNLSQAKLFVNDINLGFIKTFKKSISMTNGDIIFLCDQDDVWLPNKVEEMSNIIYNNKKILSLNSGFNRIDADDLDLPYSRLRPFSSNNNLIRKYIPKNKVCHIDLNRVLTYNISPGCTLAFKAILKEEFLKYDINLPHDWTINIIAAKENGLYFYNKELIKYRIHSSNTLGLGRSKKIEDRIKRCEKDIKEKEEMKILYNSNYLNKIIKLYNNRKKYLYNKKVFDGIKNIFTSFNKNGLIDTTFYDFIIIIKEKDE